MDASDGAAANDSGERCGSGKGRGGKASDGSYVGGGADWVGGIGIARGRWDFLGPGLVTGHY
jgi:hypothetical protein